MRLFPIFHKLKNRPCLVVGGGDLALSKVQHLLNSEAKVTVVSSSLHPILLSLKGKISTKLRSFIPQNLEGREIVFAASEDPQVNRAISLLAQKKNPRFSWRGLGLSRKS
jgi:siroheme synthase-like protein